MSRWAACPRTVNAHDDPPQLHRRIAAADAGTPLLQWLAKRFTYCSTAEWGEAIVAGRLHCNGAVAAREQQLAAGDTITCTVASAELHVEVLFEDRDCVVVDKPAGSVVHVASAFPGRTFLRALARRLGVEELHCVHRLDRDTSGVLLLAKSAAAMAALQQQFVLGAVDKQYLALTTGLWAKNTCTVDAPIGKPQTSSVRARRAVVDATARGARAAVTEFAVLLRTPQHTLVRALPRTGRTHQIRVHLEHLGHPLLGDKLYGRDDEAHLADVAELRRGRPRWRATTGHDHHLLHAAALTFAPLQQTNEVTVRAPQPAHFAAALAGRPVLGPPVQEVHSARRNPLGTQGEPHDEHFDPRQR